MGSAQRQKDATILVVDDEPIALEFCRTTLTRAGFTVITAATGDEALRRLKNHSPISLALLDVVMPHMSGAALARRIETTRPGTKIILMSGFAPDEVKRVIGKDAADYRTMWKPFTPDALVRMVRNVLDAPPPAPGGKPAQAGS